MLQYTLGSDGYFRKGGEIFIPYGVNYWPARCGVDMWRDWPQDEIQADLDCIVGLGFSAVRFFLLWPDFEPASGQYSALAMQRLGQFVQWCDSRDLAAIPTLFVGFMSGGYFYPQDKAGNMFADAAMRRRCAEFAQAACRAMRPWARTILAVDHGNEVCALPDSATAGPDALRAWSRDVSDAIVQSLGDVTVMSGLDQNQVSSERGGWRFDTQPGCACFSMHGYPVAEWWPLALDGLADPLTRELLPLSVAIARAHGPVMLQEFGTIATACADRQREYLDHVLPACWQAGANGFLWWCLHDVTSRGQPYERHSMEGVFGLVDADRRPKPIVQAFRSWQSRFAGLLPAGGQGVALYWPHRVHEAFDPQNPGNRADRQFRALSTMATGLRLAGRPMTIATAHGPWPAPPGVLFVSGSSLEGGEIRRLREWVTAGGRLIWQGLDMHGLGAEAAALMGAGVADLRSSAASTLNWHGQGWRIDAYRRDICPELVPHTASVLARDGRGVPQVLRHDLGQGRVVVVVADIGEQFAREPARRDDRSRWGQWVAGLLHCLESPQA